MFIDWNSKSLTRFTRQVPKLSFILIYPTQLAPPITIQDSLQSMNTNTLSVYLWPCFHTPQTPPTSHCLCPRGESCSAQGIQVSFSLLCDSPGWPGFLYIALRPAQSSIRAFFTLHCSTVLGSLHSHFSSRHLGSKETSMILARWVPRTRSKSEAPGSELFVERKKEKLSQERIFFLI